jgi:hypothetical protein
VCGAAGKRTLSRLVIRRRGRRPPTAQPRRGLTGAASSARDRLHGRARASSRTSSNATGVRRSAGQAPIDAALSAPALPVLVTARHPSRSPRPMGLHPRWAGTASSGSRARPGARPASPRSRCRLTDLHRLDRLATPMLGRDPPRDRLSRLPSGRRASTREFGRMTPWLAPAGIRNGGAPGVGGSRGDAIRMPQELARGAIHATADLAGEAPALHLMVATSGEPRSRWLPLPGS